MQNAQSGTLELVDSRPATTTDQTVRLDLGPNFSRFIDPSGNLMARVKWFPLSPNGSRSWQVSVDQAVWAAGPASRPVGVRAPTLFFLPSFTQAERDPARDAAYPVATIALATRSKRPSPPKI